MNSAPFAAPDATQGESSDPDAPRQFRSRRAFLVWAVALGLAPPQRLTERIVAEVEAESGTAS